MDFYHFRIDVYTHPQHIYVQTTCEVNFASDDSFKLNWKNSEMVYCT